MSGIPTEREVSPVLLLYVISAKAGIRKNIVTFVFRLLINPLGVNPLLQCLK